VKRAPLKRHGKKHSETKALDMICREIVMTRDHNQCRRCGKDASHGRALQSAHIFPKGQYPGLRWEISNLLALCFRCHFHWWHKNPVEAMDWITRELGTKEIERLRLLALTRRRTDRKALRLYLGQMTTGR
jgi:5-methylcytosine-specific restriction endonuclease McrA